MRRILIALLLAVALPIAVIPFAEAAEPIPVSLEQQSMYWTWAQGTGNPATEFRVKCGIASGTYTLSKAVPVPASPQAEYSQTVKGAVPGAGIYFCVVTAANPSLPVGFQESAPSNEVAFRALAITTPGNLGLR